MNPDIEQEPGWEMQREALLGKQGLFSTGLALACPARWLSSPASASSLQGTPLLRAGSSLRPSGFWGAVALPRGGGISSSPGPQGRLGGVRWRAAHQGCLLQQPQTEPKILGPGFVWIGISMGRRSGARPGRMGLG